MGLNRKYYFSYCSPNRNANGHEECGHGTHNEMTNIGRSQLAHYETMILLCTKKRAKTEAAISKEIKLNLPIVSQLVTDLMIKGLLQRTRNRRTKLFSRKDSFSTSLEGLLTLEHIQRNGANRAPLFHTVEGLKYGGQKILEEATANSMTLKLFLGTVRLLFRATKYALIR